MSNNTIYEYTTALSSTTKNIKADQVSDNKLKADKMPSCFRHYFL